MEPNPADPGRPPNLGFSLSIIWPGYVPNAPAHEPHGGPGVRPNLPAHPPHGDPGLRAPVSLPEPSTLGLFGFGAATVCALRRRSRRHC